MISLQTTMVRNTTIRKVRPPTRPDVDSFSKIYSPLIVLTIRRRVRQAAQELLLTVITRSGISSPLWCLSSAVLTASTLNR